MARVLFHVAALLGLAFSTFASDHRTDDREKRAVSTCTPEFAKLPGHTMCLRDSPRVTKSGVSMKDRKIILRTHNRFRSRVSPPATDLAALVWSDKLAAVAQKWANQCAFNHDKERSIPSLGMSVGQNMARGYGNWKAAITGWHSEVKLYKYGPPPDSYMGKGGWKKVGHYTQIVMNSTYLVGCGYARCGRSKIYTCNYGNGQLLDRLGEPYTRGRSCSACPNNCRKNLCQCKGLICKNGGKLDLATCSCKCRELWQGPTCSDINCPPEDKWFCGRGNLTPASCKQFYNIPTDCPIMCGLCPSKCKGLICKNGGKLDLATCSCKCRDIWQGPTCSDINCPPEDKSFCGRGNLTRASCKQFYNIPTDCPIMCGLCPYKCKGMICKNGGKLDVATCSCKCRDLWHGPTCSDKCKGLICKNGGKLDVATCSCKCRDLWRGPTCSDRMKTGMTPPRVLISECYNLLFSGTELEENYDLSSLYF